MKIEQQIRQGLPQVGVLPYGQVHAHSTGNPNSTAQNEADYMQRRPVESGFFSHVVGNGRVIQTAPVNRGAYDVAGGWNAWGYAHVELIESHKTQAEFDRDYKLYVELLRQLADEAGLPKTLDKGDTGILTHEYCTYHQPYNSSDHVDPYPYLAKWGISRAQFKHDVENGIAGTPQSPAPEKPTTKRKGAKAMFVYTLITKKGENQLWGVNGNTRFHFATTAQYNHYLKIVKANGGDTTTTNKWKEGGNEMRVVELLAPNISQK